MSSSDQQQQQHWRPTEAQLRWAQFHLVKAAPTDTGTSTTPTTEQQQQQQQLATSHAAYLERAATIAADGYRVFCDPDDYDETASLVALEQAFVATKSSRKNRRFQAALHALLRTMQATQCKLAQTVEHEPSSISRQLQLLSHAKEFVHDPDDAATLVQELNERHPEVVRHFLEQQQVVLDTTTTSKNNESSNNTTTTLAHMVYDYYESERQVHPSLQLGDAVGQYFGVTNTNEDPYVDAIAQAIQSLQGTLDTDAHLLQRAMDMAERELLASSQTQQQPPPIPIPQQQQPQADSSSASLLPPPNHHNNNNNGSVVQAYSAFRRRSSNDESGDDDHSSMTQSSAFVPSSFRNVWQGIVQHRHHILGRTTTTMDDDDGSEHKSMEFQDAESLTSFVPPRLSSLSSSNNSSSSPVSLSALPTPTTRQRAWSALQTVLQQQLWNDVLAQVEQHPWLASLEDDTQRRVLLHRVCAAAPPTAIVRRLLDLYPAAAYKVDAHGNVPLHCAAAAVSASASNVESLQVLVQAFSSGTSIRNYQGLLPLHVCLQQQQHPAQLESVVTLCNFPQATAIADNRGNLPLHTAAVHCNTNTTVLQYLIQQAEFHVRNHHLRFKHHVKSALDDADDDDDETVQTGGGDFDDDTTNCRIVRNDAGATPLALAIAAHAPTASVVALTTVSGGLQGLDALENTALHWCIERGEGETAMAVLETVPEAATVRNEEGVLPIEVSHVLQVAALVSLLVHTFSCCCCCCRWRVSRGCRTKSSWRWFWSTCPYTWTTIPCGTCLEIRGGTSRATAMTSFAMLCRMW